MFLLVAVCFLLKCRLLSGPVSGALVHLLLPCAVAQLREARDLGLTVAARHPLILLARRSPAGLVAHGLAIRPQTLLLLQLPGLAVAILNRALRSCVLVLARPPLAVRALARVEFSQSSSPTTLSGALV